MAITSDAPASHHPLTPAAYALRGCFEARLAMLHPGKTFALAHPDYQVDVFQNIFKAQLRKFSLLPGLMMAPRPMNYHALQRTFSSGSIETDRSRIRRPAPHWPWQHRHAVAQAPAQDCSVMSLSTLACTWLCLIATASHADEKLGS